MPGGSFFYCSAEHPAHDLILEEDERNIDGNHADDDPGAIDRYG